MLSPTFGTEEGHFVLFFLFLSGGGGGTWEERKEKKTRHNATWEGGRREGRVDGEAVRTQTRLICIRTQSSVGVVGWSLRVDV